MTSDSNPASVEETLVTVQDLSRAVECLLFITESPLTAKEMALALETEEALVQRAAEILVQRDPSVSGLRVEAVAGGWRTVTRPEYARAVARFVGKRAQKLSRAALETLAILAYNQPCTQPEVEAIRGVDSSGVLKSLFDRGLVRELGRKDAPGRPILYGTTDDFLVYFGLNSLEDLPDSSALEALVAKAEELHSGDSDSGEEASGEEKPEGGEEPAAQSLEYASGE